MSDLEQAGAPAEVECGRPSVPPASPLAALARAFGSGAPRPPARLGDLARELGLERLEWWPADPATAPLGSRGRPREREVDRPWLGTMAPGTVRERGRRAERRRPRLAAGAWEEIWVRTSVQARLSGWLRLVGERREWPSARELVGLADLVAAGLVAGGGPGAGGAGDASHTWLALVHDLRNELTFAQLALQRAALEEAAPGGDVLETLARARELCGGALRGDAARRAPRAVALREVLQGEARAAAHSDRGPGGVTVRVRCPRDLAAAADPVALGRVLRNLLLNSVEASEPGGVVSLHAEAVGARVRLVLEDHGRGMTLGELRALFRPGATGGAGTGWGTASILDGVAELGGRLAVESGPGEGTRVEVELWAAPDARLPGVALVDADPARAARRVRQLEAAGLGVWVLQDADQARGLLRDVSRLRTVEMPAGSVLAGWRELRADCRARGVSFEVRSCAGA